MKLAMPEQMRKIDEFTIKTLGIPGMVLMENASARVADEALSMMGGAEGRRILILAGKGNNGGDAFAAARQLKAKGAFTYIYTLAPKAEITGDAGINLAILEKLGLPVTELSEEAGRQLFEQDLARAELVVDGIFGTGLKGEVTGRAREAIEAVNASGKPVLSIDIPSGVCGETGRVLGCCIKASRTVTFCLPKTGLVVHPGCESTGGLKIVDIGIPEMAVDSQAITNFLIDRSLVTGIFPRRRSDSSKGDYGRVLAVTGSTGMTGSGCLCANAALRAGAGLVYAGVPASLAPIYEAKLTEPIVVPLEDHGSGRLSRDSIARLLETASRMDVVAVGPGLSVNDDISSITGTLIRECKAPLILDADALNVISHDVSILGELKAEAVITPHPGEMSRLAGLSIEEIQRSRLDTARAFAVKWKVVVVLKGSRTVVALPDGSAYVNPSGNPGMATGGSGDVLTGMIAGLAGQGARLGDAAIAGVYLHGLAGDAAARARGMHGMVAGDIIEAMPSAMREFID